MSADRRTVLTAGAALALPAWIARAFAGEQSEATAAPAAKSKLDVALERAREAAKPLLMIASDAEGAGQIWGELFAHATEATWLDLALVEVACLPRADFVEHLGKGKHEALWGAVFETDEKGGARGIAGALPAIAGHGRTPAYGAQVRARAAALAKLVGAAVVPDDSARARRVAQCTAGLGRAIAGANVFELHGRHEAVQEGQANARLADFDRFAAAVRFDALAGTETERDARSAKLALAARVRLYEQDPPGARWETAANWCPPCGMGFTPGESRYFLRFLTQ